MAYRILKEGDTPTVPFQCTSESGRPVDVSGASPTLTLARVTSDGSLTTVPSAAGVSVTVVDGPTGRVEYDFGADDFSTPGEYRVAVELADGREYPKTLGWEIDVAKRISETQTTTTSGYGTDYGADYGNL